MDGFRRVMRGIMDADAAPRAGQGRRRRDGSAEAHVLVVDDDARLRGLLSRYLAEQGFRVTTAASAAEARDKLRVVQPDLLVLDVMMPGETGLALTAALRQDRADVPILLLTARGAPEDRIAGFEAGADDYLGKPFEPYELVLRLRAMLRRAAAAPATAPAGPVRLGRLAFDPARGELCAASRRRPPDRQRGRPAAGAGRRPDEVLSREASSTPSRWTRPASAPSTSRSPACAARWRPTRASPASSTPSAAAATC